ncbi:putative ARID DNA-binding domain superfamily [Helianthus annuus]|nr:putative ARID DNA-binding domain superfamily [Helianthus annuus]
MLKWFITVKLGITTRPLLEMMEDVKVKRDGRYRCVTDDNLWSVIAKDMGYEYQDGEYMRIIYAMYLDVLVYYYRFKNVQGKVFDKEMVYEGEPSSESCHERSASLEVVKDEAAMDHYALYAGNDWEGAWKMHKRRRKFDFKEARKAVDEANRSVLMFAAKHY